jgi:hypothetical protein
VSSATAAQNTANSAVTTANSAVTKANEAKSQAASATAIANQALSAANNAVTTATDAATLALDAQASAGNAQNAANNAQIAAETAAADAQAAQASAANAEATVLEIRDDVQAITGADFTDFAKNSENLSDLTDKALARTNLGLGNVDNTRDVDKPISTAMQTALNGKVDTTTFNTAVNNLNTSKAPLASPVFTGNPTAPTPAATDNDTSLATTAFVRAAMALFGVGANGPGLTTTADFQTPGEYSGELSIDGLPAGVGGRAIQKFIGSSTYGVQLLLDANDTDPSAPDLFLARNWRGGVPIGDFKRFWHTGNLVKQTGPTDTTAGSLMTVGAFGLGAATPPRVDDIDAISSTMLFTVGGGNAQNPFGGTGASGLHFQEGATYGWQLLGADGGTFALKGRIKSGGVWGPWLSLLHTGNTGTAATKNITVSTAAPSGGSDGDIWIQY